MKKLIIIIDVLLVLLSVGLFFAYKTGLVNIPYGNVVIKNQKYGFELSYPRKRGLFRVIKSDNGLPGNSDGEVYSYRAEGGYAGPFTDKIYVNIYNISMEKYLSKEKFDERGFKIEDVTYFGKNGKIMTVNKKTPKSPSGTENGLLHKAAGGSNYCELFFENKNLLYILPCDIAWGYNVNYFKFYND